MRWRIVGAALCTAAFLLGTAVPAAQADNGQGNWGGGNWGGGNWQGGNGQGDDWQGDLLPNFGHVPDVGDIVPNWHGRR